MGYYNLLEAVQFYYATTFIAKAWCAIIDAGLELEPKGNGLAIKGDKSELEQVLPELVHPLYSNYKAIDYIKLIPLLIKGIQELNKKIKDHGID